MPSSPQSYLLASACVLGLFLTALNCLTKGHFRRAFIWCRRSLWLMIFVLLVGAIQSRSHLIERGLVLGLALAVLGAFSWAVIRHDRLSGLETDTIPAND